MSDQRTSLRVGLLVAAGWRALVASSGGPLVRELTRGGAEHITLPLDTKNPLAMKKNVLRLAAVLRDEQVDLVHARSRAPAWSVAACGGLQHSVLHPTCRTQAANAHRRRVSHRAPALRPHRTDQI